MTDDHITNSDRVEMARVSLLAHLAGTFIDVVSHEERVKDPKEDVIDLVTNLMHFMVKHDIEVNEVISMAKVHLEEELAEEAES